jgi:hypothetical protein
VNVSSEGSNFESESNFEAVFLSEYEKVNNIRVEVLKRNTYMAY